MSSTNKYRSPSSTIVAGPGTMYNEVTKMKPVTNRVNENTNTYAVTVPYKYKQKRKNKSSKKSVKSTKKKK